MKFWQFWLLGWMFTWGYTTHLDTFDTWSYDTIMLTGLAWPALLGAEVSYLARGPGAQEVD